MVKWVRAQYVDNGLRNKNIFTRGEIQKHFITDLKKKHEPPFDKLAFID